MRFYRLFAPTMLLAATALILSGCAGVGASVGFHVSSVRSHPHRPPAHAPAHGHHKKHHEHHNHHDRVIDMVYDSGLGVYVVAEAVDIYFHDALFFRLSGHDWVASGSFYGPWEHTHYRNVPRALRKKHDERRHQDDRDHDDDDDDNHGKHKGKDKKRKRS